MDDLLRTPPPSEVNDVLAIYAEAFPPEERADTGDLLAPSPTRFWLLERRIGRIAGFATCVVTGGVGLLEYLAVRSDLRNAGIGGQLVDTATEAVRAAGAACLFVETEPPGRDAFGERRLRFYARHGAHPHPCAPLYAVPRLDGRGGLVPMVLLQVDLFETELRGGELRAALSALWIASYGVGPDDPLLIEMLNGLAC